MIKFIAEWLIDTIVIIVLCIIALILCVIGLVMYPIRPVSEFFGKQTIRITDIADEFLRSGKDND